MSTIGSLSTSPQFDGRPPITLVDLANRFGEIPANRICFDPPPGEATERDLLSYREHHDRLFELVEGTLIEKTMGTFESFIALNIAAAIQTYLQGSRLGAVFGADGQLKIKPTTIRVPDVSFISKERLKSSDFRKVPIASVSPNLAVEVISPSNSRREMSDKLLDYFQTGSEEVWYVYPEQRELHQYTGVDSMQILKEQETLTTRVLPGFALPIASIFIDPLADDVPLSSGDKSSGEKE